MKRKQPLGCMTPSALIAGVLALILVLLSYIIWGGIIFSPGPLNAQSSGAPKNGILSHADLSRSCSTCHTIPLVQKGMNIQCINCHTEIKDTLREAGNLHGALFVSNNENINCLDCHTEHIGPDGEITYGEMGNFPHELIGYSIQQHLQTYSQAPFECQDCHVQDTYLAFTEETCLACHAESDLGSMIDHTKKYGPNCLSCHDGHGNYGEAFDHNSTSFQLTGAHIPLACADCHSPNLTLASLQNQETKCITCHIENDPHAGQFGEFCSTCHITEDWQAVTFEHAMLIVSDCQSCHLPDMPENHFEGQCSNCHIIDNWETVTFDHQLANATNCIACHTEDAPRNHFTGQCSQCHVVTDWDNVDFDHTFPINHEGAKGDCKLCHDGTPQGNYQTYTCYNCHEHTPAKIKKKHDKEGIPNYENCIECHWDGREHD